MAYVLSAPMCRPKSRSRSSAGSLVRTVATPSMRSASSKCGASAACQSVLEVRPLGVVVEARPRAVQRVRVAEAAAADARPAEDGDGLEQRQAKDAVHAQAGGEEVAAHVPRRARELVVGEAPAGLDDRDAVALLASGGGRRRSRRTPSRRRASRSRDREGRRGHDRRGHWRRHPSENVTGASTLPLRVRRERRSFATVRSWPATDSRAADACRRAWATARPARASARGSASAGR